MVRSTFMILAVLATAATAIASVQSNVPNAGAMINHTQMSGPLIVEQCAVEDCSDTPQNS